MSDYVDFPALLRVAAASLVGGVGLVALYAVAVRYLARDPDSERSDSTFVAVVSLAVVLLGVTAGLYALIVA